ncbi:MAG: hypothetical protein KJ718_03175 [Nanoarchaeota archaeon]|nr:hypothetical protein [Nanoarchaeota archaeon]MBU1051530.1 hypothetical protein [Nanoarchaeota archaeon]
MKNKKNMNKAFVSLGILGVVALLGMSMVFAYQGDPNTKGPDYSEERHEAMEQAFDNLDYDAWVALMSESGRSPRVLTIVTEDNFATFAEAHGAMENGDMDLTQELRAELGLNNGIGPKDGNGFGSGKGMKQGSMQGSGMRGQHNNLRL